MSTSGRAFCIATAGSIGATLCALGCFLYSPLLGVVATVILAALLGGLIWYEFGIPLATVRVALDAERHRQADHAGTTYRPSGQVAADLGDLITYARSIETRQEERLHTKDEAVSSMVHELRTPLTTITASVDMIQEGYASEPEELQAFLEQASIAARHMGFLINDVLDSAAVDAGRLRMDMADWDLGAILKQIAEIMQPLASMRSIDLTIPACENVMVRGDHARILQVVFNLVSNAIKYSPESSKIELRSSATPLGAVIEVIDEGIGVPLEARKKLFTKFHRPHAAESSTATGTGIGLYLAKTLIERMGGTIGYENREDVQGSVFWATLPLAHEPSPVVSETH